MIDLKGERHAHTLTDSAGDSILTAFDLPADSVLKHVSCEVQMVGVQAALEREKALMYAVAGYVFKVEDPDDVVAYDTLWDRFVPKYTDVDTMDLNTGTVESAPFWEPGEANFDEIFDIGDMPRKIFMRRKLLSFADVGNAGIRFQPAESPFEPQWIPADKFHIRLNRPIRVSSPSVVIFALASPALDDTTTSRTHLTENEWGRIQFVESTLEMSLIDQLNLVQAGAETPWEDASVLLRKHLAPDVFEQTGATFLTESWNVFTQLQFTHSVPGSMDFRTVDITP